MIAPNYKSQLIFVEKSVTKEYYKTEIMESLTIQDAINIICSEFIFQPDEATAHTSNICIETLRNLQTVPA